MERFYDREQVRAAARRWAREGVETGSAEAEAVLHTSGGGPERAPEAEGW